MHGPSDCHEHVSTGCTLSCPTHLAIINRYGSKIITNLWNKEKTQYYSRRCWHPQSKGTSTHINISSKSHINRKCKKQNNACNVDDSWYLPRVVEALDLDFPDAECQEDSNHLQSNLVAVDSPKKVKLTGRVTYFDGECFSESILLPVRKKPYHYNSTTKIKLKICT